MKSKLFQNKLTVKKSSIHGYGVFADKAIKKGQTIEECYAVITKVEDDTLGDYFFNVRGKNAVLTGFGWIYNHSEEPNADYYFHYKQRIMIFKATKPIKKGEEIYVTYGDDWFKSRDLVPLDPVVKKKSSRKKSKPSSLHTKGRKKLARRKK